MNVDQQKALALARARRRRTGAGEQVTTTMPTAARVTPVVQAPPSDPALAIPGTPMGKPYVAPTLMDSILGALHYVDNTGAIAIDGGTKGVTSVLGAPVDLINQAPMLANLIPGVKGVGPISQRPLGGSQSINEAAHLNGFIPGAPEPTDAFQRVLQRVGFELGANSIPVGGALTLAARLGKEGAKRLPGIAGMFAEPAAVAPFDFIGNEVASATAAGGGAGIANEMVGADQTGDNFWSDFVGSMAGVSSLGALKAVGGTVGNLVSAATGSPKFIDDLAGREVADRIINNSTDMADMSSRTGGQLDTTNLAAQLRRPAPIEDAIPGYRANIGDRSRDPGLSTFAFNQDAASPGAANTRRVSNEAAINDKMSAMDPGGDPAQFRADLETARDTQIAGAENTATSAQSEFERYMQSLTSSTPYAEDRGAAVRGGLANSERAASDVERAIWGDVGGTVDPAPLATGFDAAGAGLPIARRQIIADLKDALDIPRQLSSGTEEGAAAGPFTSQSGRPLANPDGTPFSKEQFDTYFSQEKGHADRYRNILADGAAHNEPDIWYQRAFSTLSKDPLKKGETWQGRVEAQVKRFDDWAGAQGATAPDSAGVPTEPVDIREITALQSRLTTAQRNALRGPQPDENRAHAIGLYLDELKTFMTSDAVPADAQKQIGLARSVSRDVNERFNRPNDPIASVLSTKEGHPDVPDSAVARRFVQPDAGQASNIDRLLAETDLSSQAVPVRQAIKDEILADIEKRGLMGKPDQLERHLQSYSRVFDRFPDLRAELMQAAGASRTASATRQGADDLRRDLTTPGRSAMANYLRYADESAVEAIQTVLSSPRAREATRELLAAAGGTPGARRNARAALWMEIERRGKEQAPGITGSVRWNGKRLRDVFADQKTNAVAEELWADNPQDLEDIRHVFDTLAGAEGSTRARAVGSSGTPQSLSGKFDPSLSAGSIASRARSVTRGVLSPTVAVIDVVATWLRGRAAQVQSRAIDTIASSVVNNPDLAADLLEKFNPADYAAKRRLVTQKFGVRATQLLNLLDEVYAEGEAPAPNGEPDKRAGDDGALYDAIFR